MNISGINPLLFPAIVLFLSSCHQSSESTVKGSATDSAVVAAPNFNKILRCASFSYDEGYFTTADNGCSYDPKSGNIFGNLAIYLIPKEPLAVSDDAIADENRCINNLTTAQLKADFDIYVYVIDQKYLNYNPKGDPAYYQRADYVEKLYAYDGQEQKWNFLDSITISDSDNTKEQIWVDDFINKRVGLAKGKLKVSTNDITEKWYGTYGFTMNSEEKDWRLQQEISLVISKDSIVYRAEGYQSYQLYALSGKVDGNALKLNYLRSLDNTGSAILDRTTDFGTFTNENNSYSWTAPYIQESFGRSGNKTYVLKKKISVITNLMIR